MRGASLVLLACAAVGVAAPVPKKPVGYFPTAVGTKWEYAPEGEKEATLVLEVTEATEKDGVRTVTIDQKGGEKLPDYPAKYRVGKDWVEMTECGGKEMTPARLDLRAKPKADDKWDSPHKWSGYDYKLTVHVGSEEKVVVPAGKFTAMPHEQEFPQFEDKKKPTAWYTDGVGLVKFSTDDGSAFVLVKYTPGKEK